MARPRRRLRLQRLPGQPRREVRWAMSELTDSARAWRIQLAHLRQELLSPVNALLGYAEILHEEASRKGSRTSSPT